MRLDHDELNCLLNGWPAPMAGHYEEKEIMQELDAIGKRIGYGALAQLCQHLYEVQCHGDFKKVADLKRNRFQALGWELPEGFEDIARRSG